MVTSPGAPSCTLKNPKCSGQGLAQREHPWVHSAPCTALLPDAELQWGASRNVPALWDGLSNSEVRQTDTKEMSLFTVPGRGLKHSKG